jgi:acyl-CoA reductase-like NAD-dependent aldehyde dehydrogenase
MTLQHPADILDVHALLTDGTQLIGGVIGAPFGGDKSSGFGRTVSAESILDYTQVKSVIIDGRS